MSFDPHMIVREVSRCRAAIGNGSPRRFWIRRLKQLAAELRQALDLVERQLVELGELERVRR